MVTDAEYLFTYTHWYLRPPRAQLFILSHASSTIAGGETVTCFCVCEGEKEREKETCLMTSHAHIPTLQILSCTSDVWGCLWDALEGEIEKWCKVRDWYSEWEKGRGWTDWADSHHFSAPFCFGISYFKCGIHCVLKCNVAICLIVHLMVMVLNCPMKDPMPPIVMGLMAMLIVFWAST